MTTTDRLYEITRQALKALLAEYRTNGNRDDAMHALSALTELEKTGMASEDPQSVALRGSKCPSCGSQYLCDHECCDDWHNGIQGVPI